MNLAFRLSILQFLQFFIWGSWFVTAGTYMMQTLHFSGREVGLVYINNAIAATLTPLVLGILADRFFSVEKLLALLHLVGGILLFIIAYTQSFEWFYSLTLVYVLCYTPTFSLTSSLCFHHVADAKRDFPRVRVWGSISWVMAGLLVSYLQIEAEAMQFKIAATCSILHGFYCLTLPATPPQEKKGSSFLNTFLGPEVKALFRDKSFTVLILSIGLICIPSSFYYAFVNPFLNEMGVENAAGKMSIGQIVEIFLMLALPWFLRIWRLKTIIFIGLLVWGLRYGLFICGIEYGFEALYIFGIALHGLAFIFATFSAQIYLDTRVPVHLRSTAQGFYSLLTLGIMAIVGTYIAGETVNAYTLADKTHNWVFIWRLPFLFGLGVAFLFLLFFRGQRVEDSSVDVSDGMGQG